jgi:hypothetical protein
MTHLILLLICVLSVELIIKFNFLSLFDSILNVTKKVTYIIPKNSISDHWKEKIIPVYAFRIMKYSLQILFILFLIFSLFLITNHFFNNFLAFAVSLFGIVESIIFAFGYSYLRKLYIK